MPPVYAMTWVAASRRWMKKHDGKWYSISCRKLGAPETKEGSWRAANAWWEAKLKELGHPTGPDESERRAQKIATLVRDFSTLGDDDRRAAIEALLGAGAYENLAAQAAGLLNKVDAPSPDRTVSAQVEQWKSLLRGVVNSGQMSSARFDAYCRRIRVFVDFIGPHAAIDSIDESTMEAFFGYLSEKVASKAFAPSTAHETLMTARQWINRLAELKLIHAPGNLRSRRFRFNHSAPAAIEVFTVEEVRALLEKAQDRMKLCLLLMLNCGMYQNDIAELRNDEVDWKAGTITRRRSKTRERGGPVVTYQLWPETLALLKTHRVEGELVLTTGDGNPLVRYWMENGKMRRYDTIQAAWTRLGPSRLSLKHLRKTGATLLGQHPHYKFYANHYLADSPKNVADRHYVKPSEPEFFEALQWLRTLILSGSDGSTPRSR